MDFVIDAMILEATYYDTFTVKRKVKSKNPATGITETVEVVIAENVKGALSKSNSQNNIMKVDGVGKLAFSHDLFCNPNIDIKEADIVEVTSLDGLNVYVASKPFTYLSHKETPVTLKDRV